MPSGCWSVALSVVGLGGGAAGGAVALQRAALDSMALSDFAVTVLKYVLSATSLKLPRSVPSATCRRCRCSRSGRRPASRRRRGSLRFIVAVAAEAALDRRRPGGGLHAHALAERVRVHLARLAGGAVEHHAEAVGRAVGRGQGHRVVLDLQRAGDDGRAGGRRGGRGGEQSGGAERGEGGGAQVPGGHAASLLARPAPPASGGSPARPAPAGYPAPPCACAPRRQPTSRDRRDLQRGDRRARGDVRDASAHAGRDRARGWRTAARSSSPRTTARSPASRASAPTPTAASTRAWGSTASTSPRRPGARRRPRAARGAERAAERAGYYKLTSRIFA